jgi:hypothetical protein
MRFDLTVNEFTRDVSVQGRLVVYGEQFWRPYIRARRGMGGRSYSPAEDVGGDRFASNFRLCVQDMGFSSPFSSTNPSLSVRP